MDKPSQARRIFCFLFMPAKAGIHDALEDGKQRDERQTFVAQDISPREFAAE
jgi:hypothetical protein